MAAWPPEWIRQALNTVLTTTGDIAYRASTGVTRLAIGTTNYTLGVVAGVPAWIPSPTSVLTTTGDILYASAANTLARLAAGTSGYVLTSNGAGAAPSWQAGLSRSDAIIGWAQSPIQGAIVSWATTGAIQNGIGQTATVGSTSFNTGTMTYDAGGQYSQMTTSTTINTTAHCITGNALICANTPAGWAVRFAPVSVSDALYVLRYISSSSPAIAITYGAGYYGFQLMCSLGVHTNWQILTFNNGTETTTDTGVPFAAEVIDFVGTWDGSGSFTWRIRAGAATTWTTGTVSDSSVTTYAGSGFAGFHNLNGVLNKTAGSTRSVKMYSAVVFRNFPT